MKNILHIYGQEAWHDDAKIFGTEEALKQLVKTIKDVLKKKEGHQFETFVTDGEGYNVYVKLINSEKEFDKEELPYSDKELTEGKARHSSQA
jgi:DNA-binding winged helix-turn-helix (wHTH) protein